MSDSVIPEKSNEPSGKVDFISVSPPRENTTKGEELHEHGLMMSQLLMMLEMEEVLSEGSKLLHHSSGDLTECVIHPTSTTIRSTSFSPMRGSQRVLKKFELIRIESIG